MPNVLDERLGLNRHIRKLADELVRSNPASSAARETYSLRAVERTDDYKNALAERLAKFAHWTEKTVEEHIAKMMRELNEDRRAREEVAAQQVYWAAIDRLKGETG